VTGFYTFTVSKVQTDKSLVAGSGANESSHSQSQSSEKRKKRIQIKFKKKRDKLFFYRLVSAIKQNISRSKTKKKRSRMR
jgi:hypothetical protein